MRLKDRTALICGAAGPMGEAIAQRFLEEGARLVLTDISGRRLEAVAAQLGTEARVVSQRADALVASEMQAAVEAGVKAFKRIDIVEAQCAPQSIRRMNTQDRQCQLRTNSIDRNQLLETVAFFARHKAVQHHCVFTHLQMRKQKRL